MFYRANVTSLEIVALRSKGTDDCIPLRLATACN